MNQRRWIVCVLLISTVVLVACGTTQPTPQPEPPTAAQPTAAPPQTGTGGFQEQQAAGMAAYEESCAGCHGQNLEDGFSAKLSRSALADYGTALELYLYLRSAMPKGNAGSLSDQEYYDITGYLLFKQELLPEGQVVDADSAASIQLSE